MIYKMYDPYDLKNLYHNKTEPEIKECFICLQAQETDDDDVTTRLSYQACCSNWCDCDGWVHTKCLNKWYSINSACPICRFKYKLSNKKKTQMLISIKILCVLYVLYLYICFFVI
jgi:hypothetical protein